MAPEAKMKLDAAFAAVDRETEEMAASTKRLTDRLSRKRPVIRRTAQGSARICLDEIKPDDK